jgi:hypothetical protein
LGTVTATTARRGYILRLIDYDRVIFDSALLEVSRRIFYLKKRKKEKKTPLKKTTKKTKEGTKKKNTYIASLLRCRTGS